MAVKSQMFRRHMRPQYNTRQILLNSRLKLGIFLCHAISTNFLNVFPSVLLLFFPKVEFVHICKWGHVNQHSR